MTSVHLELPDKQFQPNIGKVTSNKISLAEATGVSGRKKISIRHQRYE